MKDIDRLASLEARVARIEELLGLVRSGDVPERPNPGAPPGPVPVRITQLRKELRAAKARAGKSAGEGKGSISPASRREAVKEVAQLTRELDELEQDWLKEAVKPTKRRKTK